MAISTKKFMSGLEGKSKAEIKGIYKVFLGQAEGSDRHLAEIASPRVLAMRDAYPYLCDVEIRKKAKTNHPKTDLPPVSLLTVDSNSDEYIARKYIQILESAKKRNKAFNLELSDIEEIVNENKCYYTGVTLTNKKGCNFQRTVDRVDNREGYVKGNVVACSHLANKLKNELFESPTSSIYTNIKFMSKLIIKMHKKLKESK
jgi:hypothetical protein